MLLRIVAEHQVAENERSANGQVLCEALDGSALDWVWKVMERVVREDLVHRRCSDGIGKVLGRSDMEMEVGMPSGVGCSPADHLFCRIDSVSRVYERGKLDELSAWAAADIKHDVIGLWVEEFQDLPHALSTTRVAIRRVAFCP